MIQTEATEILVIADDDSFCFKSKQFPGILILLNLWNDLFWSGV